MPARREWILFGLLILAIMLSAYGAGLGSFAFHFQPVEPPTVLAAESPAFHPFWEVWDYIHQEFYGDVPDDQHLTYAAIRGVLGELDDPYTVLVEPRPHQQQKEQLQGHYGGIGVTLSRDEDGRVRVSPFPDSPAAKAGVRLDDVLLAIDRVPITATATIDILDEELRGEVGTGVRLTLERPPDPAYLDRMGRPFDVIVTRGEIAIPSVTARLLREDATIGYVAISRFSATTGQEVKDAVLALRSQGARRLVLDLRNNSGGLVQGAVDVTSQFLSSGVVLYEVTRQRTDAFFPVQPGGVATDLPLVVLVNGGSASAAEAVAGALQDSGRALLVGERTYGKGSVQLVNDLQDGSSLHVTAAKWLTPHRRSIDETGLLPDVAVSISQADHDAGRDTQLLRAIEMLQGP